VALNKRAHAKLLRVAARADFFGMAAAIVAIAASHWPHIGLACAAGIHHWRVYHLVGLSLGGVITGGPVWNFV
jgi:hypothetical protein